MSDYFEVIRAYGNQDLEITIDHNGRRNGKQIFRVGVKASMERVTTIFHQLSEDKKLFASVKREGRTAIIVRLRREPKSREDAFASIMDAIKKSATSKNGRLPAMLREPWVNSPSLAR